VINSEDVRSGSQQKSEYKVRVKQIIIVHLTSDTVSCMLFNGFLSIYLCFGDAVCHMIAFMKHSPGIISVIKSKINR